MKWHAIKELVVGLIALPFVLVFFVGFVTWYEVRQWWRKK